MQIAIPSKARPFRSKTKDLLTCGIIENEHWTGDGGCKDYRTDELERDCINRLIQLYPRFIRNVSNKSSQYTIKLHFD